MTIFIQIIEILLFSYFAFVTLYLMIFALAAIFTSKKSKIDSNNKNRIAILFPCYKEDNVIIESVQHALNQEYPVELFDVYVIADWFKDETKQELKKLPINAMITELKNPTKSTALNVALSIISKKYEIALVLDADNLIPATMLNDINDAFNDGNTVIQAHRTAKNLNTNFAILDAISEEINNFIFRKGHQSIGLSSALIGSGMAFDFELFTKLMRDSKAIGGMDKELEMAILKDGIKIKYLHESKFLDEKVQNSQVFSTQRKRWISAQQYFFKKHFLSGLKALITKGNVDYFDKVVQMSLLPRVILLGMLFLISITMLFLELNSSATQFLLPFYSWIILFITTLIVYLLSIPKYLYNIKTFKAIISLPKAFFIMTKNWFWAKATSKKFLHTVHGIEN